MTWRSTRKSWIPVCLSSGHWAATGEIRPAPFNLRFHVPEARADDARPAYYPLETGSAADAARIRIEVDGRATGELREIPGSGGSH